MTTHVFIVADNTFKYLIEYEILNNDLLFKIVDYQK